MRKSILLLSCSFLFITQAYATEVDPILDDPTEHLQMVKDAYIKKFEQMDANKNGSVDKEEYLKHQFEAMREAVLTTSGFDDVKETSIPQNLSASETEVDVKGEQLPSVQSENITPEKAKTLDDFSATLEEMATFDLDFDKELSTDDTVNKKRLTKEDVMPDMSEKVTIEKPQKEETLEEATASIDELLKEDTELEELISKTEKQLEEAKKLAPTTNVSPVKQEENVKSEPKVAENLVEKVNNEAVKNTDKENMINMLISAGKKNLPQKIDDITTCTDISYKDNMIVYDYSVNMDVSSFSQDELFLLQDHIKKEACLPIYQEKCPEFKPVFIKEGTNVKIKYIDKNGREISYCELNSETCK